jgi:hypothetical protein
MAKSVKSDTLDEVIAKLVRERFPDEVIDRVIVTRDEDADGDPIIDVLVVYKAKPDVSSIKGLARNIWSSLQESAAGFPVLSFRSAAEHSKIARATA